MKTNSKITSNKIGKNMQAALQFARKHQQWHSFTTDKATTRAIQKLTAMGLIQVNSFNQFKIV
jgi:hypothetical protein